MEEFFEKLKEDMSKLNKEIELPQKKETDEKNLISVDEFLKDWGDDYV